MQKPSSFLVACSDNLFSAIFIILSLKQKQEQCFVSPYEMKTAKESCLAYGISVKRGVNERKKTLLRNIPLPTSFNNFKNNHVIAQSLSSKWNNNDTRS